MAAAPVLKVIIIGGGPIGLTTAHALAKANIDFVVLERRPDIVEDIGASIVLSPQTLRIMGHLDLLNSLREISQEVLHIAAFSMKGKKYMENWCPNILKE
jgi:2-polyprenyl-6-methoxyphenol hydroxylase-like FAD-dependent oxidoreductase